MNRYILNYKKFNESKNNNDTVYMYYEIYTNKRGKTVNLADNARKALKLTKKDYLIDVIDINGVKLGVLIVDSETLKSKGHSEEWEGRMGDKGLWNSLVNTRYAPENIWVGKGEPDFYKADGWELVDDGKPVFIIDGREIKMK